MKKTIFIILIALQSCTLPSKVAKYETRNTIQDLQEWVCWDINEGRLDTIAGESYLINLHKLLILNQ